MRLKVSFYLSLCCSLLSWSGQSFAYSPGTLLGAGAGRFEYVEPNLMSEKGMMFGVYGAHLAELSKEVSFRGQGELFYGRLEYDGAVYNMTSGAVTPHKSKTTDIVLEAQGDFGLALPLGSSLLLRPFGGLGVRSWLDRIDGGSGYRRHTTYFYLPVGVELAFMLSNKAELSFEYQNNIWLRGQNKSYLTDVNPSFGDHEFEQKKGRGYQLAAQLTLALNELQPFMRLLYKSWDVDDSETKPFPATGGFLLEPKNNTKAYFLILGLKL